jgi:hypothetical protein
MRGWDRLHYKYQPLNFTGKLQYPGLIKIQTIGDGSCFFHAVTNAYCPEYIENKIDRKIFIRQLRQELSTKLGSIDPNSGKTYYDSLSRGYLSTISQIDWPEYKLESLQKTLLTCRYVDNVYQEFISNLLNKDIYLISETRQNFYPTGDDYSLLHQNRESIVILYCEKKYHYELIGIEQDGQIFTSFPCDHPLIELIKQNIKDMIRSN